MSHVVQIVRDTGSVLTVMDGGCWWSVVVDASSQSHLVLLLATVKKRGGGGVGWLLKPNPASEPEVNGV